MDSSTELSEGQLVIVMLFYSCAGMAMTTLGVVSNLINIKTFIFMGPADGVTVSLLVLSVNDVVFLVARMCRAATAAFMAVETLSDFFVWFPVEPSAVHFYFAHAGHIFFTYRVLIMTFVAVARCLCVVRPFTFKHILTQRLTFCILAACLVACLVCLVPIFGYMKISAMFDQRVNSTRHVLVTFPGRELVRQVSWTIRDVGIAIPSQAIVIACVLIKIKYLKAASRFRHKSHLGSMTYISIVQGLPASLGSVSPQGPSLRQVPVSLDGSHKLGSKDLNAIRQVVLISVVFVICNSPKIMITIAGLREPGLSLGGQFENIYLSVNWLTDLFQVVNAGVGSFIYYHYNSRFRKTLQSMS